MPKLITDIKEFIRISRRKDARVARIRKITNKKTKKTRTKFKIRCSRYLYTLVVDDVDKAEKLKQSLPPTLPLEDSPRKPKKA
ncbi:hypothetical protein FRB99_008189 [Tulasnella sp. 403]|nr:hypothetical protein FRB99_008189 [Tulasnella sp. 403]